MVYVVLVLCAIILFLLYRLDRSNPFRRVLRPTYSIRARYFPEAIYLSFTSRANSQNKSLRTAIADAAYSYPEISTLVFENLCPTSSFIADFGQFSFRRIDLSNVRIAEASCLEFWIEHLALPAEVLVLPKNLKRILVPSDCRELRDVYISSPVAIPAYKADTRYRDGIHADRSLVFHVPRRLLQEYQRSQAWDELSFIDDSGYSFPPLFLPYDVEADV